MLQNLLVDLVKKKFFRLGETNQVEIEYEDSKKFLGKLWWGQRANQSASDS